MKNKIEKAITFYEYGNDISVAVCDNDFKRSYKNFTDKDTLKNWSHTIYCMLSGNPYCNHIKAKNLLFQGNDECWKYFERTAVFWTYGHSNNDEWIDHLKAEFEYALYVERKDLLDKLIELSLSYLTDERHLSNK